MARDSGSLWSPLLENGRQGSYTKTQFIVHSTGDRGTAAAIFNYFNRAPVVVESTFVVGRGPEDPTRQLLDSASGADANLGANQRGISVEVVGTSDDPFTDWQIAELIRLGHWARANHPIEPRICPTHNTSGFGWHVLFGTPGPWTPVAKECPGATRIQQLQTIVFPAIFAGQSQEDDLLPNQAAALARIDAGVGSTNAAVGRLEVAISDRKAGLLVKFAGLCGQVAALQAVVTGGGGAVVDVGAVAEAAASEAIRDLGEALARHQEA